MESEFTVGKVFSQSVDVFKSNFWAMLVIGALASLPQTVEFLQPENSPIVLLSKFVSAILSFLLQGAVVYGVFQHLTGSRFSLGASFNVGLKRLGHIFILSIVVGFLTGVGMLLLIIPGIIIHLILWVSVPVNVVEKTSIGDSLQRSKDLTEGRRMRILGLAVVMMIFIFLAMIVFFVFMELLGEEALSSVSGLILYPVGVLTIGLATAFQTVVVTTGYYALRRDKEGIGMEDLASVFD